MNYLILGGTGYLGLKFIEELYKKNIHVIVVVRRQSNNLMKILKYNVTNWYFDDMESHLQDEVVIDCAFNFSCKYLSGTVSRNEIMEANFINPLCFYEFVLKLGIKRFISIDTALPGDFNIYTYSKKIFQDYCSFILTTQNIIDMCFLNIKLENFYGEDEPKDRFIPWLINKMKNDEKILLTDGLQKRDFVYINDVISTLLQLAENMKLEKGKVIDIPLGCGESPSIREAAEFLKANMNSESELVFGAIEKRKNEPNTCADLKILNSLGIIVECSWQEGFMKMLHRMKLDFNEESGENI
ncbi:MAG: NAD(P)-dependent oxidoreductase [Lachnospiraceae bacterium]|nr:NAD(P)-dependent oxidoreductase [Lachnospiraceae bacterium]